MHLSTGISDMGAISKPFCPREEAEAVLKRIFVTDVDIEHLQIAFDALGNFFASYAV